MPQLPNDTQAILDAAAWETNYHKPRYTDPVTGKVTAASWQAWLDRCAEYDRAASFVRTMNANVGTHAKPIMIYCYEGRALKFTSVGGYNLQAVCHNNSVICLDCALSDPSLYDDVDPEYDPFAYRWSRAEYVCKIDIYYEGKTLECAACGCDIESAYGDPFAEETD